MRTIDISKLTATAKKLKWAEIEKAHLKNLKPKTPKERSDYMNKYRDWNQFQEAMIKLYGYKCWYSEAPIGAGDFEVDHFRPKNRSKQFDGSLLKENGYWWLAYNWKNYRLSGGLVNKLRVDRLNPKDEVKGKGDYFPLYLKKKGKGEGELCEDSKSTKCELPILLDPTDDYDVSLLTFDEGGTILPCGDTKEKERAKWSIFFYHLDLEQLDYQRSQIWNACKEKIEAANEAYNEARSAFQKRDVLKMCYGDLRKMTNEHSVFSTVAITCIKTYASLKEYKKLLNNFNY